MEERILRIVFILITCTIFLFYMIGDDINCKETGTRTGEPLQVCDECYIYYMVYDMILGLLRAGLHLLWFYYTLS